eukprot:2317538-Rhodomonas_salina.1
MFVPRIELAERNEKTLCQGAHSVAEFVKHTSRQVESKLEIQVSEGGREHAKEKTEPTKYPLQIEDAGSAQVDRANKTKFQSYEGAKVCIKLGQGFGFRLRDGGGGMGMTSRIVDGRQTMFVPNISGT